MSIVLWEKKDTVAVLTMNNKENRQNLDFANAMIKSPRRDPGGQGDLCGRDRIKRREELVAGY